MKFLSDTLAVAEFKTLNLARYWWAFLMFAIAFPLTMFFMMFALLSEQPEAVRRIVAGTLVYGASFTTANMLGQQAVVERFGGSLKLVITMPVSKAAYVFGSLLQVSLIGAGAVVSLFTFATAANLDISLTLALAPMIVLTVLTLAGITLFSVSFVRGMQEGNIVANLVGMLLVIVSPVYFTMEQAPVGLRLLGYVSPLRYAADGITKALSGQTDVWTELAVLLGFSIATMSLGLWRLPWREK